VVVFDEKDPSKPYATPRKRNAMITLNGDKAIIQYADGSNQTELNLRDWTFELDPDGTKACTEKPSLGHTRGAIKCSRGTRVNPPNPMLLELNAPFVIRFKSIDACVDFNEYVNRFRPAPAPAQLHLSLASSQASEPVTPMSMSNLSSSQSSLAEPVTPMSMSNLSSSQSSLASEPVTPSVTPMSMSNLSSSQSSLASEPVTPMSNSSSSQSPLASEPVSPASFGLLSSDPISPLSASSTTSTTTSTTSSSAASTTSSSASGIESLARQSSALSLGQPVAVQTVCTIGSAAANTLHTAVDVGDIVAADDETRYIVVSTKMQDDGSGCQYIYVMPYISNQSGKYFETKLPASSANPSGGLDRVDYTELPGIERELIRRIKSGKTFDGLPVIHNIAANSTQFRLVGMVNPYFILGKVKIGGNKHSVKRRPKHTQNGNKSVAHTVKRRSNKRFTKRLTKRLTKQLTKRKNNK
jgi:hypothetical protein